MEIPLLSVRGRRRRGEIESAESTSWLVEEHELQHAPAMHKLIEQRLSGILQQMRAAHDGSAGMSDDTKGTERELVVDLALRSCLPPQFRFGSGEVTDKAGERSGQMDILVELPFVPSFPLLGTSSCRLYPIEGVGAAIEVKSNLAAQWPQVVRGFAGLQMLKPNWTTKDDDAMPKQRWPWQVMFVAVGFRGWSNMAALRARCEESQVHSALQIEPPLFYCRPGSENAPAIEQTGPAALAAFLFTLNAELVAVHARNGHLMAYLAGP